MFRFYVNEDAVYDNRATITGSDVNHIRNVLRMKSGDRIIVNTGAGTDYYCRIDQVNNDEILLEVESSRPCMAELPVKLYLFQALPKQDKNGIHNSEGSRTWSV